MKPWLKKVTRLEPALIDRSKYLRLDKNERVINFEKKFLNFLKKKLNSYFISAYPETTKIKRLISKKIGVNHKNIFISAGSDMSLKTCFELYTKNYDRVIVLDPTFGMVNVFSKKCLLYNSDVQSTFTTLSKISKRRKLFFLMKCYQAVHATNLSYSNSLIVC